MFSDVSKRCEESLGTNHSFELFSALLLILHLNNCHDEQFRLTAEKKFDEQKVYLLPI